eukprot:CAMPEP_0205833846 /NCGR_PEP_ID=MMETSP0206-20130828/50322_1 /ASSEMBLY_ACC=CAM_ASM_000279 /TAXON_ID=36767 /ORGANISM="Euplotes focardii, Strain TN1" /LENGTH=422 /DNA_ID=CAMNT_0053140575 /DNA_START=2402 /DNA_END=3670 /DNA_ORIENTATION=-
MDLSQYIPTVSNYFIDPTTRNCFEGKFCYDCLVSKFPGYAASSQVDTDSAVIKQSRGKLRIIEKDLTNYGFSIVTNGMSEIQFSTSGWDTTIAIPTAGTNRQSYGPFYIQTDIANAGIQDIYVMDGSAFTKLYTTTEPIVSFAGFDRAIWWPTKDFFLVRQYDEITWNGFGLNVDSIAVKAAPTTYPPEKQFEPFSTGPIKMDGELPLDSVFISDHLVLYRKNTLDGNNYLSVYSWTPGHFMKEANVVVASSNTPTSLVSFGTDGALLWHDKEKTGILYAADGTPTTITVEVTDGTLGPVWTALAAGSADFRLLQARPSPDSPTQNPTVYAHFTNADLFTVTLDIANTKIVLDPVVTLDQRFNLYQPVDIGHFHLANMVVHPCDMETTEIDIYDSGSILFYELGSASTIQCIELTTSETIFN